MSGSSSRRLKQLPKFYSTCRKLRNEAERQRRDRLNRLVNELAALVPFVSHAPKKVDKTSILRLTAAYLRLHKILRNLDFNLSYIPSDVISEEAFKSVCNGVGGFLLVVTSSGKVVYASETIEDAFDYFQSDVLGRCFYSMIHQDDVPLLRSQLQPKDDSGRRSFYCRLMKKNTSRNDCSSYEIIHIKGQLKIFPSDSNGEENCHINFPTTAPLTKKRRSCSQEVLVYEGGPGLGPIADSLEVMDELRSKRDPADTHILVSFVEVVRDRPITELSWVESMRDEYITRHKMDGNIVYVDHRISFVTGFMPEEVIGKSAFEYIHHDDLLWCLVAQIQMLGNSKGQGLTTYRLHCKDDTFVTLRSRGFMEVNQETGKVDTFICINTVLSTKAAEEEQKIQQKKLRPLIHGRSPEDIVEIICHKLPSNMNALVKGIINQQTLSQIVLPSNTLEFDANDDECFSTVPAQSSMVEGPLSLNRKGVTALAAEVSTHGQSPRLSCKAKCSSTPLAAATSRKKRRVRKVPRTDASLESWSNGPASSDAAEGSLLPNPVENPIEVPSRAPVPLTPYPVTPFLTPTLSSKQEDFVLDVENETFRAIRSFQPSYSEIENWGYPMDEKSTPVCSTTVMNQQNTAIHY